MTHPTEARAWIAVAVTIVVWASAFAAIRAALKSFTALELGVLRLGFASLTLLVVAPFVGLRRPAQRDLPRIVAAGLTGMATYQILLNAGEQTVTPGTASILVNTGPVFVALLAIRFLGERLTARAWLGVAVSFSGALIIAFSSGRGFSVSSGALLVLGAALSQSIYFVIQKPLLAIYTPFETTTYAMISGALMLLPFLGSVPKALDHASAQATEALIFLALGASALGFFAWGYANARLQVSRAATTLYLVPAVAILVAWIWLDQLPALMAVAGGAVAICGVILTKSGRIERPTRASQPNGLG